MKNHEFRPTGSQAFVEVNENIHCNNGRNWGGKRDCGYYRCGGYKHGGYWNNRSRHHQKWNVYERHNKENVVEKNMLDMMPKNLLFM